jgi:hypothetical protein
VERRAHLCARRVSIRAERLSRQQDRSGSNQHPRGAWLAGATRRGCSRERKVASRGLAHPGEVTMRAFRKFDPVPYRAAHGGSTPAKAAKVAEAAPAGTSFSRPSNFSRFGPGSPVGWSSEDWRAYFDERAAIREYDAELGRAEAKRLAVEDVITHWLCAHPPSRTSPNSCAHCCGPERSGEVLIPILARDGHTWLHDRCWQSWIFERRLEARGRLQGLGAIPAAAPGLSRP